MASGLRTAAVKGARGAIKGLSVAADMVRRSDPGITILIYHRVGAGAGGQMDITPECFDEQLAWLKANTRILSLDEAVAELRQGDATGGGAGAGAGVGASAQPKVVLTFDDGTTDWVDHVLPALDVHQVPATFYVATSFVDEQLPLPGEGRPITWSGLGELASSPMVAVGSHTHRHMLLDRLAPTEIDEELDRATQLLEDRLGSTPRHFAYPKAVAGSPEAERAVRARFDSAVLAGTRANHPGVDVHRLWRSPIQTADGMRWFRHKAVGRMRLEDDMRQWANRMRYRGLDS